MKKMLSVIATAAALGGCATAYQPHGLSGGFDEVRLDQNVWRVSFRGNGYTSPNRAQEITLLRSSELCLLSGFRYFVILDGRTDIRREGFTTPLQVGFTRRGAYVYGGQSFDFSMPSTNNTVMCLESKPDGTFSYDARTLFVSIGERYGVKPSQQMIDAQRSANEAREARLDAGGVPKSEPIPVPIGRAAPAAIPPTPQRKTGKDTYQAELLAKQQSCSATPVASLAASGGGFETYSIPCTNGDTWSVRCEFGNCRLLQ